MLLRSRPNRGPGPFAIGLLVLLTGGPTSGKVSEPEKELQTSAVEDARADTPEENEPASTFYATATVEA